MEKKDLLTAEIQIVTVVSFLFISSCAGVGLIFFQPDFNVSILLQTVIIIIAIFTIAFAFWVANIFLKIYDLKKEQP